MRALAALLFALASLVGALPAGAQFLHVTVAGRRPAAVLQPGALTGAPWSAARSTVSTSAVVGPSGNLAYKLVEDTSANSHPLFQTASNLRQGRLYFASVDLQATGRTQARIAFANTAFAGSPYVTCDLTGNGTVTPASGAAGSIIALPGSWYRCTAYVVAGASGPGDIYIQPSVAGAVSYTGNGTSGLYVVDPRFEPLTW